MPYRDLDDAIALANRGMGSLALSLFTFDKQVAEEFVLGAGAYHGRMVILDRTSAKESTGHGSPLPVLVHGGPGRAGGGEEMGGVRGVKHYMQRTALQGGPEVLSKIIGQWLPGADKVDGRRPPVPQAHLRARDRLHAEDRRAGPSRSRISSISPISPATLSTPIWTRRRPRPSPIFGGRVAHGYLILSFAAGLFVDPDPGPVLANTGLETLRFLTPLYPGDSMRVELTVKSKSIRDAEKGEVRWAVEVFNQKDEIVATYELMTMNVP